MNIVYLSSFTCSFNPGNDGVSVFRVTYSTRLVHKISDWRTFTFLPYQCCTKTLFIYSKLKMNNVYLSSFTCSFNPRNDGVSVFRVTYSTRLVHKISDWRTFTFCHTNAVLKLCLFSANWIWILYIYLRLIKFRIECVCVCVCVCVCHSLYMCIMVVYVSSYTVYWASIVVCK